MDWQHAAMMIGPIEKQWCSCCGKIGEIGFEGSGPWQLVRWTAVFLQVDFGAVIGL